MSVLPAVVQSDTARAAYSPTMGSSRALSAVIPRDGAVSLGGYTLHDDDLGEWVGATVRRRAT